MAIVESSVDAAAGAVKQQLGPPPEPVAPAREVRGLLDPVDRPGARPPVNTPPPTQQFLGAPISNMPGYHPPAPPLPQQPTFVNGVPFEPNGFYGPAPTPLPYTPPSFPQAARRVGNAVNQTVDYTSELGSRGGALAGQTIAQGGLLGIGLRKLGVPNTIATGGLGALPGSQQTHEDIGGAVGGLAGGAAPMVALYAVAPEVGIPTAALDAYFAVRGTQGALQTWQDYQSGKIDAKQALIQAAPDIINTLPFLFHGAKLGGELKGALEESPAVQRMGGLAGERGSLEPPVGPEGPKVEPPASAEGANLPVPPETAVAPEPHPLDAAILQATEAMRSAEKLRPEQEAMFQQQRGAQLAKGESILQANQPGAEKEARSAMAGAFERPQFSPLELSPEARSAIEGEINTSPKLNHAGERLQAHNALQALEQGQLPQPSQLEKLGRVMGRDFVDAVETQAPSSWRKTLLETMGISRALQATFDLSATLRQGIILGLGHPIRAAENFVKELRAFGSERYHVAMDDAIESHPDYHLAQEAGVDHLKMDAGNLNQREEVFQSHILQRIPILGRVFRASERAFLAFTNGLRHDVFYDQVARWREAGVDLTPKRMEDLANYVNNATGRGNVRWLGEHAATVNALFFSPRFLASRGQLIADLLKPTQDPEVRKLVAKDLGAFVATGVGALSLLKLSGAAEVNLNPKSSDFGKYKIGNQRHDFWAGFGPIARVVVQGSTGEKAIPGSQGNVVTDRDRVGAFTQFLRNKLAPVPSLGVDISQGTPSGQDVNLNSVKDLSFDNPLLSRITPLFIQDAVQSYTQGGGGKGLATGLPGSLLGETVQSYETSPKSIKRADQIQFKQELSKAGFDTLVSKRDELNTAKQSYVDRTGGADTPENRAKREAAAKAYDKHNAPYKTKLDKQELDFWKQHKDLLQQAYDAGVSWSTLRIGEVEGKKLLGIR